MILENQDGQSFRHGMDCTARPVGATIGKAQYGTCYPARQAPPRASETPREGCAQIAGLTSCRGKRNADNLSRKRASVDQPRQAWIYLSITAEAVRPSRSLERGTSLMAAVPRVALSEFFKSFSPTYVLGTTYTVSLAFFEGLVLPEIDRARLRRCLLLCDRVGFQRALVEASALRFVGRDYMAVCAPTPYSFHPKVWLMLGADEAALLVGSGNLTQSGFMTNLELFDAVRLTKGCPHRTVVEDILRFLDGLGGLWAGTGRDGLLVLDMLAEMREALEGLGAGLPPGEAQGVRFLTNFGGALLDQFREFFEGGALYAAAPYFGGSASALRSLREKLDLRKLKVFPALHAGDTLDVPVEEVTAIRGASAHRLALSTSSEAFAHLKMYGSAGPTTQGGHG